MRQIIVLACLLVWGISAHAAVNKIPVESGIELQAGESRTVTIASDDVLEIGWTAVQKTRCTMHCVEAVDKSGGYEYAIATDIGASMKYTPKDGKIVIEYRNKAADHAVTIDIYKTERVCDAEACAFLGRADKDGHWMVYKIGEFKSIETSKDGSYSTISGVTVAGKEFTSKFVWWSDDNNGLFSCYKWIEKYLSEGTPISEYAPYVLAGKSLEDDRTVMQSVDTCAPKAPNFGASEESVF